MVPMLTSIDLGSTPTKSRREPYAGGRLVSNESLSEIFMIECRFGPKNSMKNDREVRKIGYLRNQAHRPI